MGMFSSMSVKDNITLSNLDEYLKYGLLNKRREVRDAKAQVQILNIKLSSVNQNIDELSGGNQQKTIIARWLLKAPSIFIFDEPTRGIDVGAKFEIYRIIRKLSESGSGVIMVSSDLPEIIGMSDRILVMRQGRIEGIINQRERRATEEEIMSTAVGHKYVLDKNRENYS